MGVNFEINGMSYINVCKTEGSKPLLAISQLLISLLFGGFSMVAICEHGLKLKVFE